MKTSDSIQQNEERKAADAAVETPKIKYPRGKHPNCHTKVGNRYQGTAEEHIKIHQWKPGQSGNPSGSHAKHDFAKQIAKAVFENNPEALYKAFSKAMLKGNAYAFQQLADRAYGKLKETHAVEVGPLQDMSAEGINERIAQLERELGLAKQIDEAGRTITVEEPAKALSSPKKD